MQFMANVKTKYLIKIYTIFFIIYIGYLLYDHEFQDNQWREDFGETKVKQLETYSPTAILLGGSNVVYSLSAELLSKETNYSWFNLGLSSEAFNDKNYWDHVEKSLPDSKRQAIEIVVYSSLNFLRDGYLAERNSNDLDAWGNKPRSWVPNMSMAGRIRASIKQTKNPSAHQFTGQYSLPLAYGDFDFDKINCPYDYPDGFGIEADTLLLNDWLLTQLNSMQALFPNARIIITIPSEYYGESFNLNSYKAMLDNLSNIQNNSQIKFEIIVQPKFKHKNMTCDMRQHGNEFGRSLRTTQLIKQLSRSEIS